MKKLKKFVIVFAALALLLGGVSAACADARTAQAKDAMIAYVGTEAFTKLTAGERQACVEWLVEGGAMKAGCRKAALRLVALAPGAVSEGQRQALVLEASGTSAQVAASKTGDDNPVIVQKDDNSAAVAIVGGLVGLIAGLVIANNTQRHYSPAPSRPRPPDVFRGPVRGPVGGPGGKGKPGLPPQPQRVPVKVKTPPKRPPQGNGPRRK